MPLPDRCSGSGAAAAYFDEARDPLHLHLVTLAVGETLRLEESPLDRLAYVWRGSILAGGHRLGSGSSLIAERGSQLQISVTDGPAEIVVFAPSSAKSAKPGGGNVHLLPVERAPRSDAMGGSSGVSGAMHADSDCATCQLWLHENRFPPTDAARVDEKAGIHSHSEDEIIFVLDGDIRLGGRLYGPGTALAIAANTLYSFIPGPVGLRFINFRAAKPGDIRFANGPAINETAYWRDRLPRPEYLAPLT